MIRRYELVRVWRLEPDHLAVVVVPKHAGGRFGLERLAIRVERHHIVAFGYLVMRPPPVRR